MQLVFVNPVGASVDGLCTYEFFFAEDSTLTFGEHWGHVPAGICGDIPPSEETYQSIRLVKTDVKLRVAQKNTCYSMQDCTDGIIALAYEDISDYDEYPEHRLVFHFGEEEEKVEQQLLLKNLTFEQE